MKCSGWTDKLLHPCFYPPNHTQAGITSARAYISKIMKKKWWQYEQYSFHCTRKESARNEPGIYLVALQSSVQGLPGLTEQLLLGKTFQILMMKKNHNVAILTIGPFASGRPWTYKHGGCYSRQGLSKWLGGIIVKETIHSVSWISVHWIDLVF